MGIRQQLHLEIASTGMVEKDGDLEAVNLLQQHALAIKVVMRGDVGIQRPDHFVQITNINNTVYPIQQAESGLILLAAGKLAARAITFSASAKISSSAQLTSISCS